MSAGTPIRKTAAPSVTAAEKDPIKAVEKLETKTKAVNSNNIARVANSQLFSGDDKLHQLLSLKTGRSIERFPETPNGINKLSLTLVDAILNALEADRGGNEKDKRERLRIQIGLKPNPA